MSKLAALFTTANQADGAASELRLRGFTEVTTTPARYVEALFAARRDEGESRRRGPDGTPEKLFVADQAGLESHPSSLNTWSSGATSTENIGWSLLESLSVSTKMEGVTGKGARTLLIVEAGRKGAIARAILESNGARDIRDFAPPPPESPAE
ncbi:MAG TPA: hypothetical protein VNQ90_12685 [Chthoniobacteraceae bacterium]|nr:hypothetical protein [Chthoniobacteraceae bacterium]